jgi:WD40 repeat protein
MHRDQEEKKGRKGEQKKFQRDFSCPFRSILCVSWIRSCFSLCILCASVSLWFALPASAQVGAITATVFSPDGKQAAVGTYQRVLLYDTAEWKVVGQCGEVEDYARSLTFAPDGVTLAIGSGTPGKSGRITLWNTAKNTTDRFYTKQFDTIEALAYRTDGKGLIIAAKDKKVSYFVNLPSEAHQELDEHNGRVQAAAFSPKDNFIYITGASDRIVKVWDEAQRKTVVNFDQSEGSITGLAFLGNGIQFVGSSMDGRLYWWQVNFSMRRRTYRGDRYRTVGAHDGGVMCLGISGNRKRLITGGMDKAVRIWDAEGGGRQRDFPNLPQPMYAVALDSEGKIAIAGGRDGILRVWDVEKNALTQTLTLPAKP